MVLAFWCLRSERVRWRAGEGKILVFCWLSFVRNLLRAYRAVGARRLAAIQVRLSARSWVAFEASDTLEASIRKFVGIDGQAQAEVGAWPMFSLFTTSDVEVNEDQEPNILIRAQGGSE